jgi:hypothetical protein
MGQKYQTIGLNSHFYHITIIIVYITFYKNNFDPNSFNAYLIELFKLYKTDYFESSKRLGPWVKISDNKSKQLLLSHNYYNCIHNLFSSVIYP